MVKRIFDAVAIVGKYTDRQGNEKSRYVTVGAVFEDDKKRMSLKIEALPVGGSWNGWVSFFSPKESQQSKDSPSNKTSGNLEDDIPW